MGSLLQKFRQQRKGLMTRGVVTWGFRRIAFTFMLGGVPARCFFSATVRGTMKTIGSTPRLNGRSGKLQEKRSCAKQCNASLKAAVVVAQPHE